MDAGDQLLCPPAWVHAHAERQVEHVARSLVQCRRRRHRVQRRRGAAPLLADRLERVMDVGSRLDVDRDVVRARTGDLGDLALRPFDHEMHIEVPRAVHEVGKRPHDDRPEGGRSGPNVASASRRSQLPCSWRGRFRGSVSAPIASHGDGIARRSYPSRTEAIFRSALVSVFGRCC